MNCGCGDPALIKLFDKSICTVFCSCEHDATFNPFLFDDFYQQTPLVGLPKEHNFLINTINRHFFWCDVHFHCIVQERTSKVCNRRRHCCAEEEILSLLWQQFQHLLDVSNKAHVKHSVGFVKDKEFNICDVDVPLVDQIEKATRCGNQNIKSLLQGPYLWVLIHPTKNHFVTNVKVFAVSGETFIDLSSQLSGW